MKKNCEKCGEEYEANARTQKYCNNPCNSKPSTKELWVNRKSPPKSVEVQRRWANYSSS